MALSIFPGGELAPAAACSAHWPLLLAAAGSAHICKGGCMDCCMGCQCGFRFAKVESLPGGTMARLASIEDLEPRELESKELEALKTP